ncbi:hypothetical protein GQ457_09G014660 [Hibiscus cannabinus]
MNASAVAKIVEVVKRWKWGPELETQLDKIQFTPNMTHITQAMKVVKESDASLSLFRWAKQQSWYVPSDVLMVYVKDGSVDLALRWLSFMGSSGIRTNNFIVRQLFESCMKNGLYESAKPLLENYVNAAAKVDLVLYTSILAYLVRCQEEQDERHLMAILGATKHKAHAFLCGLFTGPEQRKQPVLSFVREFFQGI